MLNEIIVTTIGIWKYLKIQDGRQNIEILLYVFIIGQFYFNLYMYLMYTFMLMDATELA